MSMKCSVFMVLVVMIPSKWHVGRMVWIHDLARWKLGTSNLSESAVYVDRFAHHPTPDKKEIIMTKALIGESFDYGTERNRSIKMPPIKEEARQNMVSIKYDSVAGITKDTSLHAV